MEARALDREARRLEGGEGMGSSKRRVLVAILALSLAGMLGIPGATAGPAVSGRQLVDSVETYRIDGVSDKFQRTDIARTGADIVFVRDSFVIVRANQRNLAAIRALGYHPVSIIAPHDFPPEDADYHNYAEMVADISATAAANKDIVRVFSIGRSYEGREIWAVKISDNVWQDEDEPEVVFDGLHHAREHLTVEESLAIMHMLVNNYDHKYRIHNIVDTLEIYVLFMVNPDGGEYDIKDDFYHSWRKNRQPTPRPPYIGTDLNRNYDYKWDCCGGSSDFEGNETYHGPFPESAPEVAAYAAFVDSRVIGGEQQISAAISFHTYGELVLWPYGYTFQDVPPDMDPIDHEVFVTMGTAMADLTCNQPDGCFTPMQSSDLYITDGSNLDWMYGAHRIFAFTFELFPDCCGFYPPDEVIEAQTKRLEGAVMYLLDHADCPYEVIGEPCQ
jgi:carboxypeptidase T